ncbi:MAG: Rieske 2Fe-2S domain-containing protein [Mycolicibacterium insubricum]
MWTQVATQQKSNLDVIGDDFPPIPYSWYAVAFESELRPGTVLTRNFVDSEIVVFRGDSGRIAAVGPYCPHLGAHLGKRSRVVGDCIECPFHEFRFDTTGRCVDTPYDAPAPNLELNMLPVRNVLGMVMVYYGPADEPPAFELDLPDSDPDWHRIQTNRLHFRAHPQDVNENGLDYGHFQTVHKFTDFTIGEPMRIEGPRIHTAYGGTRPLPLVHGVRFDFTSVLIGLGFSLVEIAIQGGWTVRQMVLPTPVGPRETDIYIGISARRRAKSRLGRLLMAPIEKIMARIVLAVVSYEVQRDQVIWDEKTYLEHPKLTRSDGPIGKYRSWARQFYRAAG